MTVQEVINKAKEMNLKFFDGKLEIDEIHFRFSNRMTSRFGHYSPRDKEIALSTNLLADHKELMTTLCHELVHAYQHERGYKIDHGASFKSIAKEIRSIDPTMKITRTRKASKEVADKIAEKRNKRGSKITSYVLLINANKVVFMKNLTKAQVKSLTTTYRSRVDIIGTVEQCDFRYSHCQSYDRLRLMLNGLAPFRYYKPNILDEMKILFYEEQ